MNGKPSRLTSRSGASAPTTSRERGPAIATVAHCSVTEVQWTRSSGHSVCSHSSNQSSTFAALPVVVVTRKRSSDEPHRHAVVEHHPVGGAEQAVAAAADGLSVEKSPV